MAWDVCASLVDGEDDEDDEDDADAFRRPEEGDINPLAVASSDLDPSCGRSLVFCRGLRSEVGRHGTDRSPTFRFGHLSLYGSTDFYFYF